MMIPTPILTNMTVVELEELLRTWGQPAFRAKQIYRQLYVNFIDDPMAMTDLPLPLRTRLRDEARVGSLELTAVQVADAGLTRKALFRLPDGAVIETVLMVYPDRATVCVSTQAGCAMGCVFCATGKLGLLRNLTPGEIVEQALWASRELRRLGGGSREPGVGSRESGDVPPLSRARERETGGEGHSGAPITDDLRGAGGEGQGAHPNAVSDPADQWWSSDARAAGRPPATYQRITNLVFMGMGEPFANYDRWWAAVERLHDPQGFNLGARNMTVSTVGLPHGIRRLADERLPINLAISLHAPDDALRSALMPVNDRYPIAELIAATREYTAATRRRVSFEYVLLQGRNDHPHQAIALARLLRGQGATTGRAEPLLCHVNLIPWNPIPGMPLGRSDLQRVEAFRQILIDYNVPCTVRIERGVAIAAACGQLAGANAEVRSQHAAQ